MCRARTVSLGDIPQSFLHVSGPPARCSRLGTPGAESPAGARNWMKRICDEEAKADQHQDGVKESNCTGITRARCLHEKFCKSSGVISAFTAGASRDDVCAGVKTSGGGSSTSVTVRGHAARETVTWASAFCAKRKNRKVRCLDLVRCRIARHYVPKRSSRRTWNGRRDIGTQA